jgi:RimJ/RimL family protein N-acetyltransferase
MPAQESPQLETERMWLCAWSEEDLGAARPIFTDADVMRYINGGQPLGDFEIFKFIMRQQNHFRSRGLCLWKLLLKPSGQFAGFCGLQPLELDGKSEVEIGWRLIKECWGHGLATEAARAALNSAVNKARLERVIAIAMPENRPSLRIMENLEMKFERATRKAGFDVVVYSRSFAPQETADHSL